MQRSEKPPRLDMPAPTPFPRAPLAVSWRDERARPFPQAIAHRGYRAEFPENTLSAFAGAIKVGAHALETDIHLSKDGIVVLSHDATLKRCFGRSEKIIDCLWSDLSRLRTLEEPHEAMPRLADLLEYLARPGLEDVWVLLDIKVDNDPDEVMRRIAKAVQEASTSRRPWHQRIVLGCWTTILLPRCDRYLPGFPVTHIGFNLSYARQFFQVPNVSFNLLQKILLGPAGRRFLHDAKAAHRPVFVWTVDDVDMMRWSIRSEVDGVITDDPKKFLDVCRHYHVSDTPDRISWKMCANLIILNILSSLFSLMFRWRHGHGLDPRWLTRPVPDAS